MVRLASDATVSGLALLPPAPRGADAAARNVRLLSILRWLAVGGQLATILLVHVGLGVRLPLVPMIAALAVLVALNLAIAQIGVHLVFFLHITTGPDNTNNTMALAFGVLVVFLLVAGSIWIMGHMNHNMMLPASAMPGR